MPHDDVSAISSEEQIEEGSAGAEERPWRIRCQPLSRVRIRPAGYGSDGANSELDKSDAPSTTRTGS